MKKLTTEEFIEKAKSIHGDKYDYSQVEYKGNHNKVKIFCNKCKQYFWQEPHSHLRPSGCPYCIGRYKTTNVFIEKAREIHGNKYDYSQYLYKTAYTKSKIICNTCKKIFYQEPHSHLQGHGCPHCTKRVKLTLKEFIKRSQKIHNDRYDYSQVHYLNASTPIKIKCKKCGKIFKQIPSNHLIGKSCPYCKQSKGELQIQEWLEKHAIIYEAQKRFKDCRDKNPLPFDFYLPNYNLCIEYQGRQHYKEGFDIFTKRYKEQEKAALAFKKQQRRDRIKQKYCKINNILFLKIKYNQDIEKILKREFNLLLSNM